MRFARISSDDRIGIAVEKNGAIHARFDGAADLDALVAQGPEALAAAFALIAAGPAVEEDAIAFLPPLARPGKVICLGLNYADHAAEGGFDVPEFPTIFARFPSNLIGHGAPILKPTISDALDYEGEMVAVIGKRGRNIDKKDALSHVIGYSVFNDGSVRDYQMKTPQWTAGKNFDDTGVFGPWLVTANDVPPGGAGLKIETRLNGDVVQSSDTSKMVFDVATTVALLSTFLTLEAGDVLVMGTPSGIGFARTPPLFMKAGDVVEVEIEKIGLLRNPVRTA